MAKTLYMVVEHFKGRDAVPVYRRFRDHGRMAPEGLSYVSSWVDSKLERCYQLMETDNPLLLEQWIAKWSDIVDFEVHPVISSAEAAQRIAPLLEQSADFEIRRAGLADVDEIAAAHLDSIRSIGPGYYDAAVVADWGAQISGDLYLTAMARGETFYIAVRPVAGTREVLGFSSHRVDGDEHGTAVYVRGNAARRGIGTALFRAAEASAVAAGAAAIGIQASLAAVEFYKANGFEEIGHGDHMLSSGRSMPCVFMRKQL
jgi:ribosomal protein S18 acetylase RimI-like enzyme